MATLNLGTDSHLRSPFTLRQPYTPSPSPSLSLSKDSKKNFRHVFVVTGPSGCGKSSVAEYLANALGFSFIEGDNYHSPASIQKMSTGTPLTDSDRWSWLDRLRNKSIQELQHGAPGVVVTCSALKRKYRDIIRSASHQADDVVVRFLYLKATEELVLKRVKARENHYMKDNMVRSQFLALEEPDESEEDVLSVGVESSLPEVQRASLRKAEECMATVE